MNDDAHPFLAPLWRRVLLVGICAAWTATEFLTASPGWGVIALAFTGYGAWRYLYAYDAAAGEGRQPPEGRDARR